MKTYRRTSHHPFLILQSFNLLTAGFCDKISSFIIDTFLGSNTLFICLSCCAYARWNPSCNPPRPSGWLAHPLAYRNSSHQSWNMHVSRCHKGQQGSWADLQRVTYICRQPTPQDICRFPRPCLSILFISAANFSKSACIVVSIATMRSSITIMVV